MADLLTSVIVDSSVCICSLISGSDNKVESFIKGCRAGILSFTRII